MRIRAGGHQFAHVDEVDFADMTGVVNDDEVLEISGGGGGNDLVNGKGYVNHGANAAEARPNKYASIEWHGSVEPTNAVNGDTWVDTSV